MVNQLELRITYNDMKHIIEQYFFSKGVNVKVFFDYMIENGKLVSKVKGLIFIEEFDAKKNNKYQLTEDYIKLILGMYIRDTQEIIKIDYPLCINHYITEDEINDCEKKYFIITIRNKSKVRKKYNVI